ncbi:O-antigen ligase domain-containing protein [Rhizobium sp. RAF56]|uniref:O-antigen ligase domain-containing protein n=1 Tax=Rhizobium sp. RAF56 TaxID=3233062 RepID=UPI003F988C8A
MSIYRLILCATILPCIGLWVTGRAGRVRVADLAVILFCCWRAISFLVVDGAVALQPVVISFVETLGAYFLARCCIRNADDFQAMAKIFFFVILAMLPFALLETMTGTRVTLRVFGVLLPTYHDIALEFRGGLVRVQGPFDHSILFGLFCSSGFALSVLVVGFQRPFFATWCKAGVVAFTAALSLSAGPILGLAVQFLLLGWKRLADAMGAKLLGVITISVYSCAQLVFWISGRSLNEFVIGKLTFDPMSYWSRGLIFQYAWESVLNHSLLGTGMGRWDRPLWMPASIDNLWLAFAVMHGLPAAALLCAAVTCCVVPVGLKRGLGKRESEYRAAYIITVVNWCLVGMTVYYWDGTYVLVILFLGSGLWVLDAEIPAMPHVTRVGRASAPSAAWRFDALASGPPAEQGFSPAGGTKQVVRSRRSKASDAYLGSLRDGKS